MKTKMHTYIAIITEITFDWNNDYWTRLSYEEKGLEYPEEGVYNKPTKEQKEESINIAKNNAWELDEDDLEDQESIQMALARQVEEETGWLVIETSIAYEIIRKFEYN